MPRLLYPLTKIKKIQSSSKLQQNVVPFIFFPSLGKNKLSKKHSRLWNSSNLVEQKTRSLKDQTVFVQSVLLLFTFLVHPIPCESNFPLLYTCFPSASADYPCGLLYLHVLLSLTASLFYPYHLISETLITLSSVLFASFWLFSLFLNNSAEKELREFQLQAVRNIRCTEIISWEKIHLW